MADEETLAAKIYQVMQKELASQPEGRLRKVVIRSNALTSVDVAKLNDFWHKIATDPRYRSSHIELHYDPPFAKCLLCQQEFELDSQTARCPFCQGEQFKMLHEPLMIERYEME